MSFLEKSLNNLPEDVKAELPTTQELTLEDLDAVAGGVVIIDSNFSVRNGNTTGYTTG